MSNHEQTVEITYRDENSLIAINEVTGENLKHYFDLDWEPKRLKNTTTNKIILIKNAQKDLEAGAEYFLLELKTHSSGRDRLWCIASILCEAAYKQTDTEIERFINRRSHGLSEFAMARFGEVMFLIAKNDTDAFVSFRGSKTEVDWESNMTATLIKSKFIQGEFHEGYLRKAESFPYEILDKEFFEGRQIIFCGHSQGGAIAALIYLHFFEKRPELSKTMQCFTFGAPFFGSSLLREQCNGSGSAKQMFHFVNEGDPVPIVLSLALWMQAVNASGSVLKDLKASEVERFLSPYLTVVKSILEITGVSQPASGAISLLQNALDIVKDKESPFVFVGNMVMVKEVGRDHQNIDYNHAREATKALEISLNVLLSDSKSSLQNLIINHKMEKYQYHIELSEPQKNPISIRKTNEMNTKITSCRLLLKGSSGLSFAIRGQNLLSGVVSRFRVDNKIFSTVGQREDLWDRRAGIDEDIIVIYHEHDGTQQTELARGVNIFFANHFEQVKLFLQPTDIYSIIDDSKALSKLNDEFLGSLLMKSFQRVRVKRSISVTCEKVDHALKVLITEFGDYDVIGKVLKCDSNEACSYDMNDDEMIVNCIRAIVAGLDGTLKNDWSGWFYKQWLSLKARVFRSSGLWFILEVSEVSGYKERVRKWAQKLNSRCEELGLFDKDKRKRVDKMLKLGDESETFNEESVDLMWRLILKSESKAEEITEFRNYERDGLNLVTSRAFAELVSQIHILREEVSKECYIGITGFQNSGKTTFINSLLPPAHQREKSSAYGHTTQATAYPLHERVTFVDFPGTNALEEHAKLHSYLGNINNITVLIIAYDGNLNKDQTQEIVRILHSTLAAKGRSEMLVCFNKAVPEIIRHICQDELSTDPIMAIRQKFAKTITDNYFKQKETLWAEVKNTIGDQLSIGWESQGKQAACFNEELVRNLVERSINFTDLFLDDPLNDVRVGQENRSDQARKFGVLGLIQLKAKIKDALLKMNVLDKETQEIVIDEMLQIPSSYAEQNLTVRPVWQD